MDKMSSIEILALKNKRLLDGWLDPRVAELAIKYRTSRAPAI